MAHKIQIKRGNKANLPTLDVGEFGLCQDTNELFIGNSGNQKIFPPTAPTISDVEGLQTALDNKVDDSRVLTNVPVDAKFTDTKYTAGTNVSISGTTISATDTKYTAGTNVSISGTTISATDTKTTINGKTGAIAKADIVALGIPGQDTTYGDASTSAKGIVKLSTATDSTSTTLAATPSAVKAAYDRADAAFTSASNGKTAIGAAITGVDSSVVIPTDPTFAQLATAIGQISSGKKWASGSETITTGNRLIKNNLNFKPRFVMSFIKPYSTATEAVRYVNLAIGEFYTSNFPYNTFVGGSVGSGGRGIADNDTSQSLFFGGFDIMLRTHNSYADNGGTVSWWAYE